MAQDVKNDIKKAIQVNTIPLIAIMTAVTTVLTMFVKIPTPTRGYLNLSDTMIFFSSYAFGPWVGGIIGGLGPALSDLISGYPQWAIFTFIIDGLQAVLVGLLVREFKPANVVIGSLVAGVWKVFGYFIAGGILSGPRRNHRQLIPDGCRPDRWLRTVLRGAQGLSAAGATRQPQRQGRRVIHYCLV